MHWAYPRDNSSLLLVSSMALNIVLERVKTIDGITFYNDSKATNVDSVVQNIRSFDQQVILLAGGHDKMTPLETSWS